MVKLCFAATLFISDPSVTGPRTGVLAMLQVMELRSAFESQLKPMFSNRTKACCHASQIKRNRFEYSTLVLNVCLKCKKLGEMFLRSLCNGRFRCSISRAVHSDLKFRGIVS
jgi:hypothetical protein